MGLCPQKTPTKTLTGLTEKAMLHRDGWTVDVDGFGTELFSALMGPDGDSSLL